MCDAHSRIDEASFRNRRESIGSGQVQKLRVRVTQRSSAQTERRATGQQQRQASRPHLRFKGGNYPRLIEAARRAGRRHRLRRAPATRAASSPKRPKGLWQVVCGMRTTSDAYTHVSGSVNQGLPLARKTICRIRAVATSRSSTQRARPPRRCSSHTSIARTEEVHPSSTAIPLGAVALTNLRTDLRETTVLVPQPGVPSDR